MYDVMARPRSSEFIPEIRSQIRHIDSGSFSGFLWARLVSHTTVWGCVQPTSVLRKRHIERAVWDYEDSILVSYRTPTIQGFSRMRRADPGQGIAMDCQWWLPIRMSIWYPETDGVCDGWPEMRMLGHWLAFILRCCHGICNGWRTGSI